jgi:hypothetical protein
MHIFLIEQPRDFGQGQADEIRVKPQGDIVRMTLTMRVRTRLAEQLGQ